MLQLCYCPRFFFLVSLLVLVASVAVGVQTNGWFDGWSSFHSCLGEVRGRLQCLRWVKSLLGGVKLLDGLFGYMNDGLIGSSGGLESQLGWANRLDSVKILEGLRGWLNCLLDVENSNDLDKFPSPWDLFLVFKVLVLGSLRRIPFCIVWYFLFSFGRLVVYGMGRVECCSNQNHEILRLKNSRQDHFHKIPLVEKTADDISASQDE